MKILIIVALIFSSCAHNENWTEFKAKGLPSTDNSYQTLKISDDDHYYLGGHRTERQGKMENEYIFKKFPILYYSSDYGKTWTDMNLYNLKGEVRFIRKNQAGLVILNRFGTSDSTAVLKSSDNGKSWESLLELTNEHFIADIYQRQNEIIELNLRVNKNNLREVFRITDQKIDTLRFDPQIRHLHFSENGFIGIEINKANLKSLISFDLDGNEVDRKAIENESKYAYSKRTANNDILWYNNSSSTNILLFRNEEFHKIDLSSFKNYNIKEPFIEDSLIIMDGYYDKDVAFTGVIHTFLVSHDLGKTWTEEDVPSSLLLGPSDLKNGHFLSYTINGSFQERK